MFRALTCPSSGGKIVRSQPVYCADVYREWRYQMLCEYNISSWRWACWCSKHVEDNSVTNILLTNKENCALKLVDEIILYYEAGRKSIKKHQMAKMFCIFSRVLFLGGGGGIERVLNSVNNSHCLEKFWYINNNTFLIIQYEIELPG